LDSRISLLFLQSDFPENVAVGSSNKPDVEHFNVLTIEADGFRIGAPCVRSRKKQTWLPVHELSVSNLESSPCCWTGAIAIDLEGNLIGIIADTTPNRFSKKLLEFQMLPSAVVGESLNGVLADKKHVPAGWLGVTLDSQGAKARVDHVYAGSPAHQAGILPGDVIVTLDDRAVGFSDLVTAIRWKGPGASASFRVDRGGQARDIPVILGERATPKLAWTIQLSDSWGDPETSLEKVRVFQAPLPPIIDLGFVVDRLPSQLARKLRSPEPGGLLVKEIRQDSAAEKAGFQAGDILFRINGYSVFTFSDVRKSIDASRNGVVEIRFVRDGEVLYKAISLP
jgi:S1-C subfamily serine protease